MLAPALSPAHCPLCAFQSIFWQPAPQYAATAQTEHFFSGTPAAPHHQQLFLGRGGSSCWEAAAEEEGEAAATENAGADAQLTAEAGAKAEGRACCEGSVCCEGPASVEDADIEEDLAAVIDGDVGGIVEFAVGIAAPAKLETEFSGEVADDDVMQLDAGVAG